jgi:hypothetical protein
MRHKTIKVDEYDFLFSVLQAPWKICTPKEDLRILKIRNFGIRTLHLILLGRQNQGGYDGLDMGRETNA